MQPLVRGRYIARFAETAEDVARARRLHARAFGRAPGGTVTAAVPEGAAGGRFDAVRRHLLVEDRGDGALLACLRMQRFARGADIGAGFSARFYDLSALSRRPGPMAEVGGFCADPQRIDGGALRLAWGMLTRIVEAGQIRFLFGCAAFPGTDPAACRDALALLAARHLAPAAWRPAARAAVSAGPGGPRAAEILHLSEVLSGRTADQGRALRAMPPLLRIALGMGARVADHAVIDRGLGAIQIFTGLEIDAVPAGRAAALRAIAG